MKYLKYLFGAAIFALLTQGASAQVTWTEQPAVDVKGIYSTYIPKSAIPNLRNATGGFKQLTDGATVTIGLNDASVFAVTVAGNRTVTVNGHSPGRRFYLLVKQDATGSRTITWNAAIKWPGGTAPTLTTTAAATDVFEFLDTGVSYLGSTVGLAY